MLSLICCLAMVGLWVRSYRFADYLYYSTQGERSFGTWIKHSRTLGALQRLGIVQIEFWRDSSIADGPNRVCRGSRSVSDEVDRLMLQFDTHRVGRGAPAWRDPARSL